MTYPKITVVTPCHNREDYIAETIESVLSQNYPNLEYIVIDDGSTDKSWEIIQKYKDRLAYCEHIDTKSPSPTKAMNYASAKATGDIMTLLTDKSLLMHKSLFTVARVFEKYPDIEWLTGIGLIAGPDGSIINVVPVRKDLHEHLIFVPWQIQAESTFWRKSLWDRAGAFWAPDFTWASDYELWARFFPLAKLYHLNTILGAYRKTHKAHGVTRRSEYHDFSARARAQLRARVPKKELLYAELYRALRYLKPVLRNIPDAAYAKIPLLNHFCHEAVGFKDMDSLKRYKRNPFRTIYPW